jgi:transposase-like protein
MQPRSNGYADGLSSSDVQAASTAPDPESSELATRRKFSGEYKMAILLEYEAVDRDGKGRLLQREGLYTSLLSEWRKQRDHGAIAALSATPGRPRFGPIERENARLRSRVERLEIELERARHVIGSQVTLSALLDELSTDDSGASTD